MRYIYPPRPKTRIHPRQLPMMEKSGTWICQRKFDGDRCPIAIEDGTVHLFNRHGRAQGYKPPQFLLNEIKSLKVPKTGTHWLDAELLHPSHPHTVVLFDVLQVSQYFLGKGQMERLGILEKICGEPVELCEPGVALRVTEHVWLAQYWDSGFEARYQESLASKLVEGILLREKESVLDNHGAIEYEVDWQVRCRKQTKNYGF